jgi:hypothetical protein
MTETLDLFTGADLRDAGIATAEEHAEAVEPGWKDKAWAALQSFILHHQEPFMAEDVRAAADVPPPPDPRAWGGVFQRAARAGLIIKAGFGESRNRQAHCRPTALWRRAHSQEARRAA